LAKLPRKNQLTRPSGATAAIGSREYFEVRAPASQIVQVPVSPQPARAVRTKLAALGLTEANLAQAVVWARRAMRTKAAGGLAAVVEKVFRKPARRKTGKR
jgi:hypothetical protein